MNLNGDKPLIVVFADGRVLPGANHMSSPLSVHWIPTHAGDIDLVVAGANATNVVVRIWGYYL